ncbi:MAG: RNA pseudouridine synthase [Saprospiraceae bacterium]|nr:RNA pseudouridine synthase [Saprospiraceae bacterium]
MENKPFKDSIIFEDSAFLVVNKSAGIPVQPDTTGDKSISDAASEYCGSEVFVCHRIDRPVSGITILAKHKQAAAHLNALFAEARVRKSYLAIVENSPPKSEGELLHFIHRKEKENKTIATEEKLSESDQVAKLYYRHLASSDRYHLLLITMQTGRHHQIRAQLSAIGCSIKGDIKYGARRKNADRSIHLHAWKVKFTHIQGRGKLHIQLEAPLPIQDTLWSYFNDILNQQNDTK